MEFILIQIVNDRHFRTLSSGTKPEIGRHSPKGSIHQKPVLEGQNLLSYLKSPRDNSEGRSLKPDRSSGLSSAKHEVKRVSIFDDEKLSFVYSLRKEVEPKMTSPRYLSPTSFLSDHSKTLASFQTNLKTMPDTGRRLDQEKVQPSPLRALDIFRGGGALENPASKEKYENKLSPKNILNLKHTKNSKSSVLSANLENLQKQLELFKQRK